MPHDASNHANLGLALLSSKEYERAEPELKRALDLDPHYAMATQLLTAMAFGAKLLKNRHHGIWGRALFSVSAIQSECGRPHMDKEAFPALSPTSYSTRRMVG